MKRPIEMRTAPRACMLACLGLHTPKIGIRVYWAKLRHGLLQSCARGRYSEAQRGSDAHAPLRLAEASTQSGRQRLSSGCVSCISPQACDVVSRASPVFVRLRTSDFYIADTPVSELVPCQFIDRLNSKLFCIVTYCGIAASGSRSSHLGVCKCAGCQLSTTHARWQRSIAADLSLRDTGAKQGFCALSTMLKTISRGAALQASLQRCFTSSAARPGDHRLAGCQSFVLYQLARLVIESTCKSCDAMLQHHLTLVTTCVMPASLSASACAAKWAFYTPCSVVVCRRPYGAN